MLQQSRAATFTWCRPRPVLLFVTHAVGSTFRLLLVFPLLGELSWQLSDRCHIVVGFYVTIDPNIRLLISVGT